MIGFNGEEQVFKIETKNTVYAMKVVHGKFLAHLYYGKKSGEYDKEYREYPVDFAPYPMDTGCVFSLDTISTELSFFDTGDTKNVGIKIKNGNGDSATLFYYEKYRIFKGRVDFSDMPYSRGGDETLEIVFKDVVSGCELRSYYTVFYETDTITRYATFVNKGEKPLCIEKAAVCQLDLCDGDYNLVTLCGAYGNERNIVEYPLNIGLQGIYSKRGHSSHQFNPFFALKKPTTTENFGDAYAFEFVYSGDFEGQVEKCFDGRIRALMGLNHDTFAWNLEPNGSFTTPEVIMTYSAAGMNKLSQNLHDHLRRTVILEKFVYAPRPIVINTWEAVGFNVTEEKIFCYAEKAKKIGIDTVVVDDGWFGNRNNDSSALGDWFVNKEKFPNGLVALSDELHNMGLKFGIWIEPEMISPKSELYQKHPEWVLQCRDRVSSLGRRQLVLDLTNDEAINYIVGKIKSTLEGVKLEYIKWDFNRTLSEVGSLFLSTERQCEVKHRFTLGCYKMHEKLTKAFPDVLFEGCSGGGGRFDAGILFYCPQIWTSDNTDPVERLPIQTGTSIAYPLSSISAHVSDSLWNKLECTPDYGFRFNVALGGIVGYEMNISRLSKENENILREQIAFNKKVQPLILKGDLYRLSGLMNGEYGLIVVAKDKSEFMALYQNIGPTERKFLAICGLLENGVYTDDRRRTFSGKYAMTEGIELSELDTPYKYDCIYGKIVNRKNHEPQL